MLRAHHWDWLHALTFALALATLGDSERRIIRTARVAAWPTVQATVARSTIDTVKMVLSSRGGYAHVLRRVATYRFQSGGRVYGGRSTSLHPRTDAESLGVGARLMVHYDQRDPARNAVFAPPRASIWIESLLGIALVLVSGLPWHRWDAHRRSVLLESEPDDEPIVLRVPVEQDAGSRHAVEQMRVPDSHDLPT